MSPFTLGWILCNLLAWDLTRFGLKFLQPEFWIIQFLGTGIITVAIQRLIVDKIKINKKDLVK